MMKAIRNLLLAFFFAAVQALAFSESALGGTITPVGHYGLPHPGTVSDVWGYVDPNTGQEYALVGETVATVGVTILDVTEPSDPVFTAIAPGILSFDMKVWGNLMYVVTGGRATGGGRIFDLSDPSSPRSRGSMNSSHNLWIDDRGYMYLSLAGAARELEIYNLNNTPLSPELVWWDDTDGAHDAIVVGTTLYDFHGYAGTRIYDVTVPHSPFLLGTIDDGLYSHSGMSTVDGKYLYVSHEVVTHPEPDISIWNIEDPSNPQWVGAISDPTANAHNLYIVGDYAYVSYYTAGFRVYNVEDPEHPVLDDEYDTSALTGEAWKGAFGVYPFSPSGHIYVSDIDNGLFVFSFSELTTSLVTSLDLSYGDGVVHVEWRVSNTAGINGFYVYRSDSPSGQFSRISGDTMLPVGSVSYADTTTQRGASYWYRIGVVRDDGEKLSKTRSIQVPSQILVLHQNAPNPFNPLTVLSYEIGQASQVHLVVYDALGRKVRTLVNTYMTPGAYTAEWDGSDENHETVASGVYFAQLEAAGQVDSKRLVLLK